MHVTPIERLTPEQVRDIARHAAERGERLEDANPFASGSPQRLTFASAFQLCARDLQRAA
ncbi:hypothetical protein RCH10_000798 [Variovorax sp. GrIS 2.14]|uniref:hypothetical protein n=1 Tax=Variovorax sp. GrIS 2.14 TaxID=3071709 RepID=UPI0038F6C6F6